MIMYYITMGLLAALVAFQEYRIRWERGNAISREQELLAAVLAKDTPEYTSAIEALRRQPGDKIKEMELENDLAIRAAELSEKGGFPVS